MSMTSLTMSYGQMSHQFNRSNIKRGLIEKKVMEFKKKPKPKHPQKVHVWAGISKKGKTSICIFTGNMNAYFYADILNRSLVPFEAYIFQMGITDLCRIMILSIPQDISRTFCMRRL